MAELHVVVGVYSGVTDEVKVCRTQRSALAHYDRIREAYDIHTDEEAESEHDCQMFSVEIRDRGIVPRLPPRVTSGAEGGLSPTI